MSNKEFIKANLLDVRNEGPKASVDFVSEGEIEKVNQFHRGGFGEYSVTPLYNLEGLANHFGLGNIFVKDESYRFGLNAFKVLGGAYAIGHYLADKLGVDISEVSFEYLKSAEVKEKK